MAKKIKQASQPNYPIYIGALLVLILTFAAFKDSLKFNFLSWDDDVYVVNNPLIRGFSPELLGRVFTEYLWGNYHPLTVLSLSVDYSIWGLDPYGYHLTNLLLHLLNTLLIIIITLRLTRNHVMAAVSAGLLFGTHPLHVESVTWISERKDVLYTAFLLGAWWAYDAFRDKDAKKQIVYSMLLFIAACLAKGMAVIFPLLLIATDIYRNGQFKISDIIGKWPYFLVSITFGIVAIIAQQSVGAIREDAGYNLFDNIIVAFYGLCWYLYKMILPLQLTAFYPYPPKAEGELLPLYFYLAPLVLGLAAFLLYKFRKQYPEWVFAGIWYLASMVMVVKLVPLSEAITADRYFYLSSAGIMIAAGIALSRKNISQIFVYAPFVVGVLWAYLTYQQTQIWSNDLALFGDMIEKHPTLSLAYNNRGKYYYQAGNKEGAIADFIKSAELDPENESAQNNVGYILLEQQKPIEALSYFNRAIEIHPDFADGYFNLGNTYAKLNRYPEAIQSYQQALRIQEGNPGVWNNLGNVYRESDMADSAKYAYQKALEWDSRGKSSLTGLGEIEEKAGNIEAARKFYKTAAEYHPTDGDLLNRIGISYAKESKYSEAAQWFLKASVAKPDEAATWNNLAMAYERAGSIPEAVEAYKKAAQLGSVSAQEILKKNGVPW
jgi:tetratricopeptide (TPR) repeat protein